MSLRNRNLIVYRSKGLKILCRYGSKPTFPINIKINQPFITYFHGQNVAHKMNLKTAVERGVLVPIRCVRL